METDRKSVSSKRIWIFIALSSFFLLVIIGKCADGFKLKDITAHEQADGDKSPRKAQTIQTGDGKALPFRKIVRVVKVEDEDDEETDDADNGDDVDLGSEVDFKFEKVRKADKKDAKPQPIFKTIEKEAEKEEDVVVEEAEEKLSNSVLSFLNIFGVGNENEGQESNTLINWLRSFKRTNTTTNSPKPQNKDPDENIFDNMMCYLDRWPFNLVIQFDKPKDDSDSDSDSKSKTHAKRATEPISQEQFDYLLNRLPSFVLNPDSVDDVDCKKQLQIFARQLRGQRLWTLQMLDSTAKISSGILRGNVNQFGDFDQCTQIKTMVKVSADESVRIRGKYCLAHVDVDVTDNGLKLPVHMALGRGLLKSRYQNPSHFVPRYSTINWGVCLPNACSARNVRKMLEADLRMFNSSGAHFHVDVNEKDCFIKRSQHFFDLVKTNWKLGLTITFYGLFVLLAILGTLTDYWSYVCKLVKDSLKPPKPKIEQENSFDEQSDKQSNIEEDEPSQEYSMTRLLREVILSFSFKRTLARLLGRRQSYEIAAINAMKVLATFSIYLFLKFLMMGHLPITNRDKLVKLLSEPVSIFLRTPLMYLDTFLFVSGTISAFRMCQEYEEKSGISVMRRIVGRLIRSLPTLFAVLYFQTWVMPHIGSGPLWSNLVSHNTKLCEQNMWRNFFTVQNAISLEETCSPFTIQLAVDQQLFLLTPLIVWLYYNSPDIGLYIYGVIQAISTGVRFSKTAADRLSPIVFHGMNVSQFYRTANYVYSSPLQRATAFACGIAMGIGLKSYTKPVVVPLTVFWPGTLLAVWCIGWCFWYPSYSTSIDFVYDPAIMASYASWAPLLLSYSLAWLTFLTYTKNVPAIFNSILSSSVISFLSNIAYPMQMVSYVVLVYTVGVTKEQTRFAFSDLVNFQEITVIILAATIIAMLFDFPMQNIRKILIEFEFPPEPQPIQAIKDIPLDHRLPWIDDAKDMKDSSGNDSSVKNHGDDEKLDEDKEKDESVNDIWDSEDTDPMSQEKRIDFENANGNGNVKWKRFNEVPEERWRTESDSHDDSQRNESNRTNNELNGTDADEGEEQEEEVEEEEEDDEISESDEVFRRPPSSDEQTFRFRRPGRWD